MDCIHHLYYFCPINISLIEANLVLLFGLNLEEAILEVIKTVIVRGISQIIIGNFTMILENSTNFGYRYSLNPYLIIQKNG